MVILTSVVVWSSCGVSTGVAEWGTYSSPVMSVGVLGTAPLSCPGAALGRELSGGNWWPGPGSAGAGGLAFEVEGTLLDSVVVASSLWNLLTAWWLVSPACLLTASLSRV